MGSMRDQREQLPDLTEAELLVMNFLWASSPKSAREVHDHVSPDDRDWAYTTTRTVLARLVSKGALVREQVHGLFVYAPCVSRAEGLARRVRRFAEGVLQIPPARLVSMFAEAEALTDAELAELTRLMEEIE